MRLDPTSFTTPEELLQLMVAKQFGKLHVPTRGEVRKFTAIALTDAVPMSDLAFSNFIGSAPDLATDVQSRFIVKAMIIADELGERLGAKNNPHRKLPNPCSPAEAENVNKAISIIMLYTTFLTARDFTMAQGETIRKNDEILVSLTVESNGHLQIERGQIVSLVTRSEAAVSDFTQCVSLSRLFDRTAYGSLTLGTAGAVNPNYRTSAKLIPSDPAEATRLQNLATSIGIPYAVLLAIRSVESGGDPAAIRFEPHIFLGTKYDFARSDLADQIPYKPGSNPKAPSVDYTSANTGIAALDNAMLHDAVAAIQSTSWGSFQVMGFNFGSGSPSDIIKKAITSSAGAKAFYKAFFEDPVTISDEILAGWFSARPDVVTAANKYDWRTVATRYNGSGCCGPGSREYDVKMATRYEQAVEEGATP